MRSGTVYTETVIYSAPETFANEAPYQTAIVTLDGEDGAPDAGFGDAITVAELGARLGCKPALVMKALMDRGIFASVDQPIDATLAAEVARELHAPATIRRVTGRILGDRVAIDDRVVEVEQRNGVPYFKKA